MLLAPALRVCSGRLLRGLVRRGGRAAVRSEFIILKPYVKLKVTHLTRDLETTDVFYF
jgi:hypothetical protein